MESNIAEWKAPAFGSGGNSQRPHSKGELRFGTLKGALARNRKEEIQDWQKGTGRNVTSASKGKPAGDKERKAQNLSDYEEKNDSNGGISKEYFSRWGSIKGKP